MTARWRSLFPTKQEMPAPFCLQFILHAGMRNSNCAFLLVHTPSGLARFIVAWPFYWARYLAKAASRSIQRRQAWPPSWRLQFDNIYITFTRLWRQHVIVRGRQGSQLFLCFLALASHHKCAHGTWAYVMNHKGLGAPRLSRFRYGIPVLSLPACWICYFVIAHILPILSTMYCDS
jgi:hypothetical protein